MKQLFRLNPIVKKDIRVSSRSHKLSSGVLGYELILTFILFGMFKYLLDDTSYNILYSRSNVYSELMAIFPALAITQVCVVSLITPITTASLVSGERERQTFDIMLTTAMTPFSIVFGKVTSAVFRIMLYVIASIPIMSLAFVVGGMSWWILLWYLLTITIFTYFAGSIGILCSCFSRKSMSAEMISFAIYALFGIGTFVPLLISALSNGNPYVSVLLLLFNPVVFFEEFFCLALGNVSFFGATNGYTATIGATPKHGLVYLLTQGATWYVCSAVCMILATILFLFIASRKINPIYAKQKKKKKK